jgi:hypothetical protein
MPNCSYSHIRRSTIYTISETSCECHQCTCGVHETKGTVNQQRSYLQTAHGGINMSFYNRFTQDGAAQDPNFGMGYNWLITTTAYVTQTDDCSMAVIWSSEHAVWFTQTGPDSYTPQFGSRYAMTNDGSNYRVTAPDGTAYLFSQATGKLLQTISPGGQITQNVYDQGKLTETYRSVAITAGGTTTTYVESWFYEYGSGDEAILIKIITLRQRSYTTTPGSWTDIRRIQLDFYPSGNAFGNQGDLQKITLQAKVGSN